MTTATLSMAKQMLAQAFEHGLETTLSAERPLPPRDALTHDSRERRSAAAAKRKHTYLGH